jgi:hypothetical protein
MRDRLRVPVIEAERMQFAPALLIVRLGRDRDIQGFPDSISAGDA